jgi:hypothetical protein
MTSRLAPRETFPFTPPAEAIAWLGPTENSFNIEGVIVVIRFADTFQLG